MSCHLWGRTELDTTEVTQQQQYYKKVVCVCVCVTETDRDQERQERDRELGGRKGTGRCIKEIFVANSIIFRISFSSC